MTPILAPVKLRESSDNVATLHAALSRLLPLLDFPAVTIDEAEVRRRFAGDTTLRALRLILDRFQQPVPPEVAVDEPTAELLNKLLKEHGLLDEQPGPDPVFLPENPFRVFGTVRDVHGEPVAGVSVRAFDREIRPPHQPLGQAQTGQAGNYEIKYFESQFADADDSLARGADLFVEIWSNDQPPGLLLTTVDGYVRNAPRSYAWNLELPAAAFPGASEFERLVSRIKPLLKNLSFAELEETEQNRDLSFLAGETGLDRAAMETVALAFRLEARSELLAEAWYGLLVQGALTRAPTEPLAAQPDVVLRALPRLDFDRAADALKQAFAENRIPQARAAELDRWLAMLRAVALQQLLAPDEPRAAAFQQALDLAQLPADKQRVFADAYLGEAVVSDAFFQRLETEHSFKTVEIDNLKATFTLAALADHNPAVLKTLASQVGQDLPRGVRALAKRRPKDWLETLPPDAVPAYVAGASPEEKQRRYAEALAENFASTYPTTAFAGGLERDPAPAVPNAQQLGRFLEAHPDFELLTTPVDEFLQARLAADTRPLPDDPAFASGLKAVQRVFKLAPSYAATNTLLADDVHSARQVYDLGQAGFVKQYGGRPGFTAEIAQQTYQRAAQTYATTLALAGHLISLKNAGDLAAVDLPQTSQLALAAKFPNLPNLFGAADVCECDDCRSVYSPAAYFADLLNFLKGRSAAVGKAKDVLFGRRPDLGLLELNCENALTPLPYVDVVCEVLEARVAPAYRLLVLSAAAGATLPAPTPAPASGLVRSEFLAGAGVALATDAFVEPKSSAGTWLLRDVGGTYLIGPEGSGFGVVELPQTFQPADELAAIPRYVNPLAYSKLAQAVYPLGLPFDLFNEEARRYAAEAGTSRAELMDLLRGPVAPNNPSALVIAAEYAGFSAAELALLVAKQTTTQGQFWGEATNAAALASVQVVSTLLTRTGLEYSELQALLTLPFLNPNGAVRIVHEDGSCDTGHKHLAPFSVELLDRLHRFLRLWRRLGGPAWEVDLLLRHPKIGGIKLADLQADEATAKVGFQNLLLNLRPLLELKQRFSAASIEQLAALFGELPTADRFTQAYKPLAPALFSRVFQNKKLTTPLDPDLTVAALTANPTRKLATKKAVVSAALRLKEADFDALQDVFAPTLAPDVLLSLESLSALYRHATLARWLGVKPAEWVQWLHFIPYDPFTSPAQLQAWLAYFDALRAGRFTPDELRYLLLLDGTSKSAPPDKTATAFLGGLRDALKKNAQATDPAALTTDDLAKNAALLLEGLTALGWSAEAEAALVEVLRNERSFSVALNPAPASGFVFPDPVLLLPAPAPEVALPVSYDANQRILSYTGIMTTAVRGALLAVSTDAAYQAGVNQLFSQQRDFLRAALALFRTPSFAAPLRQLPADVVFAEQLPETLRGRVRYDAEQRQLSFSGRLDAADQALLLALSPAVAYQAAVGGIKAGSDAFFTAPPALEVWFNAADQTAWFEAPAQYQPVAALKEAAARVLAYARPLLQRAEVVRQAAEHFGLTAAVMERTLTEFHLFGPPSLLDNFAADTFPAAADRTAAYHWLVRLTTVLRRVQATYWEVDWLFRHAADTQVLDLLAPAVTKPVATHEHLTRLLAYFQWHRTYPPENLSWLDVAARLLNDATYTPVGFGADLEQLTGWPAADVVKFVASADLVFPADYLQPGTWERLRRTFELLESLSAGLPALLPLAAPALGSAEATHLKHLLKATYEPEQWLAASKTIQDALREQKRDALTAYLLAQPAPPDVPTGKWENPNDLFAYYLLDVEMCSCLLTSRLVQASGSVQLFVQRCLMGLEPLVRANADDDPAWNQWQWMQAYQVWVANRKVFLYPENWILPELRRDKSPFFKELEDEILQHDITRDNVETAFLNYVEKLDHVAQLDVAGTYYEEKTNVLHVVGRTAGAEPHLYFYRQWVDDAYWTPWRKVDADIKSEYLLPLVMNERLYLVWAEFREEAEPASQISIPIPAQGTTTTSVNAIEPRKRLRMFLAISEFRNGKWSPKKISKDSVTTDYVAALDLEDLRSQFVLLPLDMTLFPTLGTFVIFVYPTAVQGQGQGHGQGQYFELLGCKGYPESYRGPISYQPLLPHFERDQNTYRFLKSYEQDQGYKLTLAALGLNTDILGLTPGRFNNKLPLQPSMLDYWLFVVFMLLDKKYGIQEQGTPLPIGTWLPWFFADRERTFFVRPEALFIGKEAGKKPVLKKVLFYKDFKDWFFKLVVVMLTQDEAGLKKLTEEYGAVLPQTKLLFQSFYHPLTCLFAKELLNRGMDGLMSRKTQLADKGFEFKPTYQPLPIVDKKYPREVVDFSADGSYSSYNWELFYHAPLLIAERLSANQRFEEATAWYHFIFDPTGAHDTDPRTGGAVGAPQKFWITKPFFERQSAEYEQQRIENIMRMLADDPTVPGYDPLWRQQLENGVALWRKNPFDPHLIAQFRTVAYQKTVVMKYLDNLIAWGDQLFRQDTMESVNQATQRYVLAAEILGPRPRRVSPAQRPPSLTFNELETHLDKFSQALVDLENCVPPASGTVDDAGVAPLPHLLLYFCIPPNDQLLAYWDKVADRLYKIRHCLNIEGVARQLSLFAPPIDPGALVRAAAAGLDLGAAISGLSAPLPLYRFAVLLQKANEVCADVRALGGALSAILEKRDAESLAVLRQDHERQLLELVRGVKKQQIAETNETLAGLQKYHELVAFRRDYYGGKDFMSLPEMAASGLAGLSIISHTAGTVGDVLAGVMFLIPDFHVGASGFGGSPHVVVEPPAGKKVGESTQRGANGLYNIATILDKSASMVSTLAGFQRRKEDWDFQRDAAGRELAQIERQIAGAEIRAEIAGKELENHDRQIAQSQQVADFLNGKYTNGELYGWLLTQTSQAFFQTYQLAYDLAKKAEKCLQFELGLENTNHIQFSYWDSLRKGLLSGERLQVDLRRLEAAYLEQNRRERELTKHVSLALVAPAALLQLRQTGRCVVSLPEALFDLDYQGHYFRRIKTVALSIPCVAGPYTTISCTLRLLRSTVRVSSALSGGEYPHANDDGVWTDDDRFRESFTPVSALATSGAQNDSGLFELSFRDERYLPFEGAGTISTWSLELNDPKLRQFDYEGISDVLLHLRYTAREDAGLFKQKAVEHLTSLLQEAGSELPLRRLFSLRHEFPTEWHRFLHPAASLPQAMSFDLNGRFPLLAENTAGPKIYQIELVADSNQNVLGNFNLTYAAGDEEPGLLLKAYAPYGGLLRLIKSYEPSAEKEPGLWTLTYVPATSQPTPLTADGLADAFLVVSYRIRM